MARGGTAGRVGREQFLRPAPAPRPPRRGARRFATSPTRNTTTPSRPAGRRLDAGEHLPERFARPGLLQQRRHLLGRNAARRALPLRRRTAGRRCEPRHPSSVCDRRRQRCVRQSVHRQLRSQGLPPPTDCDGRGRAAGRLRLRQRAGRLLHRNQAGDPDDVVVPGLSVSARVRQGRQRRRGRSAHRFRDRVPAVVLPVGLDARRGPARCRRQSRALEPRADHRPGPSNARRPEGARDGVVLPRAMARAGAARRNRKKSPPLSSRCAR